MRLRLLTVYFSKNGKGLAGFKQKLNQFFKEVEGPSGAEHVRYHEQLRAISLAQDDPQWRFSIDSFHSHFLMGSEDKFTENLARLCQSKIGYPCIMVNPHKPEFLDLLSRILSRGGDVPKRGFYSPSVHHRFGLEP